MARRFIGQRVMVCHLSRLFTDAVKDASGRVKNETTGKRVRPTLRDRRPKALTDEFEVAGDTDKGGHKTEAMKRHYRRKRLPMRAKNRLSTQVEQYCSYLWEIVAHLRVTISYRERSQDVPEELRTQASELMDRYKKQNAELSVSESKLMLLRDVESTKQLNEIREAPTNVSVVFKTAPGY